MPRFEFRLGTTGGIREIGAVQSDSFSDAFSTVCEHASAVEGNVIEIGVRGFPPARYECVWSAEEDAPAWRPVGLLAA